MASPNIRQLDVPAGRRLSQVAPRQTASKKTQSTHYDDRIRGPPVHRCRPLNCK